MKKWVVLALMAGMLVGCGSGETTESTQSESVTESTSATELSSSEEKVELKEANFEIEGTAYRIKILDNWVITSEENLAFNANAEMQVAGVMVYGFKKTNIGDFDTFKAVMKEQTVSTEEFQIEETTQETEYQTLHYPGELYRFTGKSAGVKVEVQYYLLETEMDYVVVNFVAFPAFFERNGELVTEMLNSFAAV